MAQSPLAVSQEPQDAEYHPTVSTLINLCARPLREYEMAFSLHEQESL
jgi:hypothetical protein